ncbi:hypothetical protein [Niallia sp. 01092]|uniref:hypothetical protein n=1 Tax=unclassified Niallia TaxID=2837522 RepID=UPI003FCF987F
MTKKQRYKKMITNYTQKLFQMAFCIVQDRQLAELVVEKVMITAYESFDAIDFAQWEQYLMQLTTKTAIVCKKSTNDEKKRLLEQHQQKSTDNRTLSVSEKNISFFTKAQ